MKQSREGRASPVSAWALTALGALVVAACGSDSISAPPVSTPTPTSNGPASAHFALTGDAGLAGLAPASAIRCVAPGLAGLGISSFAQPADSAVTMFISLAQGKVNVSIRAGSGQTYTERDFSGTGVTGFDPAKGASIDSLLTPVANSLSHGTLGAITAIRGSVDCGNQTVGASTIRLKGTSADGAVDTGLNPFRVECSTYNSSDYVSITGIGTAGSNRAFFQVTIQGNGSIFLFYLTGTGASHQYSTATGVRAGSTTTTSAHAGGGTATETGAPADTLSVTGDATCGSHLG